MQIVLFHHVLKFHYTFSNPASYSNLFSLALAPSLPLNNRPWSFSLSPSPYPKRHSHSSFGSPGSTTSSGHLSPLESMLFFASVFITIISAPAFRQPPIRPPLSTLDLSRLCLCEVEVCDPKVD